MADSKASSSKQNTSSDDVGRPSSLPHFPGLKLRVSLMYGDQVLQETHSDVSLPTGLPSFNSSALSGFGGRVTPVNDLNGCRASLCRNENERVIRCKLASLYRLADYFRWSYLVHNHITVPVPGAKDAFLIKPFGMLDGEVTASSLITLNIEGKVTNQGSTNFDVNAAGFYIHGAIYETRPNAKCVAHIHYPAVQAVSAMKCGLLRINQESLSLGKISYLDFDGLFVTPEEKEDLKKCFPRDSKVLLMRNHGLLVVGDSIEEAFQLLYLTVQACETQVKMMPAGIENMTIIEEKWMERYKVLTNAENVRICAKQTLTTEELEWESMMRTLDGLGYNTGFVYRIPEVFSDDYREEVDKLELTNGKTTNGSP